MVDTRPDAPRFTRREAFGGAAATVLLVGCGSSEVQKIGDAPPPVALGAKASEATPKESNEKDSPIKRFEAAIKKGIELERKHPEVFKGASSIENRLSTLHTNSELIINESQKDKSNFIEHLLYRRSTTPNQPRLRAE